MANENRNRNDQNSEPNRGSGEESRSGKIGSQPGGYGPSSSPIGEGRDANRDNNVEREPSRGTEREH